MYGELQFKSIKLNLVHPRATVLLPSIQEAVFELCRKYSTVQQELPISMMIFNIIEHKLKGQVRCLAAPDPACVHDDAAPGQLFASDYNATQY